MASAIPDYVLFELFLSICCCNMLNSRDLEKQAYQESKRYNTVL